MKQQPELKLIGNPAPADGQPVLNFHSDADRAYISIGKPA
jgi:hypothetical protein